MPKNNGYAICFNEWIFDNKIRNELSLLLLISSLTAEKGYCFASNKYFAELFKMSEVSISRKIKKLEKLGHIKIDYEKRGCEIKARFIRLTKMLTDDYQKCKSTINKNVKENNTSINNTSIDNNYNSLIKDNYYKSYSSDFLQKSHSESSVKKNVFKKPTIEEIELYCKENNKNVDAESFYNFYESKNWMIGKNKMQKWKAAIATWDRKNKLSKPPEPHESIYSNELDD